LARHSDCQHFVLGWRGMGGVQVMSKWVWMFTVVMAWVTTEFLTFFALGWPIDWDRFGTVIIGCLIAVWTFPTITQKESSDG
jgi:hypothetical protein